MKNALIFSDGIRRIPHLAAFLPDYCLRKQTEQVDAVIGWGLRPTTRKARAYAEQHRLPFIALEDGFLRSIGLGVTGRPPLALVVDDLGIYYDTTRISRLEQLVLAADSMPSEIIEDARKAIGLIVANKLSKYNHAPIFSDGLSVKRPSEKEIVLVIDQTFGDMAVQYGGADADTFKRMFQTALSENPDAEIWVKTHPDVLSGKKRGYLTDLSNHAENVRLVAEDINPISLLEQADKVYCVTSQMGFEALLLGKPVVTFGLPWYAGWGVSDDRHSGVAGLTTQKRRAPRSLLQLFAAAYLQYSRYINPNTGKTGTIFDVIDYLSSARRLNEKLRGNLYCVGMSLWKQAVIKPFFNVPSCRLHFVSSFKKLEKSALPSDARLLVWGNGSQKSADFAQKHNLPILRMEDGFIRSVGLGSNLVPPLSLVIDDQGIYFNAEQPSRLEHILQNREFTAQDFQTASYLQQALTEAEISKYNVGNSTLNIPDTDRKVLLVPGQVEDDASIRHGSPEIRTNLGLLKKVRELNPDAYIIYKPHPDVVSGNRVGAIPPEETSRYADQTVTECDILTCLKHADEVHTMTSLSGFEALLRGKTVHCYGLPFYAGWGLTQDYLNLPRRTRKLALWELVAGTLIHYPNYVHPQTRDFINADTAIEILRAQKQQRKHSNRLHRSFFSKQWFKIKQLYVLIK
ncbi:capsular polysaccharide biosynthesis protein [Neisseria animaloris]|uniref:Capsule polysaccharide modification protein n=1 Tax=Neisseria animaloris TaxID=326522 RepID=A0A3S4Y6K4_9NEIS|nr:capsular polysaccharide biosynthesis protein [Neisseria animaloris]VEJ20334.1 capsule polysaccharide modification protein [Neisseria animaloris]